MSSTAARRTERLIVREVEDETVVYDLDNEQVTCLDARTAAVWQAADGRTSVAHVARKLDMSHDDVAVALVRLDEAGLMKDAAGMSRRTMLKGLGVGAAVVPLMTVVAPVPAFAASGATLTFAKTGCATSPNTSIQVTFTASGFDPNQTITVNYSYTPVGQGTTTTGTATISIGTDGKGTTVVTIPNTSGKNLSISATTSEPTSSGGTRTVSAATANVTKCP